MTAHRTVYAVTSGEWSDYRVICLFPTRELAQAYIATVQDNERQAAISLGFPNDSVTAYAIEEMVLWDAVPAISLDGWQIVEE